MAASTTTSCASIAARTAPFDGLVVKVNDHAQQVVRRVTAGDGHGTDDLVGLVLEAGDVRRDQVREDGGNRLTGDVGSDELLGEERVPLSPGEDLFDQIMRRDGPQQRRYAGGDVVVVEAGQVDPVHRR